MGKEQSQAAKEQGHNLMNKAEQNLPEAKKQGHSLLEQGQEYWNQATNYVHEHSQNLLNKGAEGAAEGSEQAHPNESYLEAARRTAIDAISNVQNYFSGSSAGSAPSAGK